MAPTSKYTTYVLGALTTLVDKPQTFVSINKITQHITETHGDEVKNPASIRLALTRGVGSGLFVQKGQSFRVSAAGIKGKAPKSTKRKSKTAAVTTTSATPRAKSVKRAASSTKKTAAGSTKTKTATAKKVKSSKKAASTKKKVKTVRAPAAKRVLLVVRTDPRAQLPVRKSADAAGYDVFGIEDETTIPAHGQVIINTGIACRPPKGTYLRAAPRSGLAAKFMVNLHAGVIDRDFSAQINIMLINHSDTSIVIPRVDAIGQLIITKIEQIPVVEVDSLPETERGSGKFGSTGMKTTTVPPVATGAADTATSQPSAADATNDTAMVDVAQVEGSDNAAAQDNEEEEEEEEEGDDAGDDEADNNNIDVVDITTTQGVNVSAVDETQTQATA